MAKTTKKTVST